jgi:hypothetical protein
MIGSLIVSPSPIPLFLVVSSEFVLIIHIYVLLHMCPKAEFSVTWTFYNYFEMLHFHSIILFPLLWSVPLYKYITS